MSSPNETVSVRRAWSSPKAILFALALAIGVLVGDLALKSWSFRHVANAPIDMGADEIFIPRHDGKEVIPKILNLKLVRNEGAVFGIGKGRREIFLAIGIIASMAMITVFLRSGARRYCLHAALALVFAGALGNMYDRAAFGIVRDMLWLFPGVKLPFGLNWPGGSHELYPWIFNIADVSLLVGLGLLMLVMYRDEKSAKRAKKNTTQSQTGADQAADTGPPNDGQG